MTFPPAVTKLGSNNDVVTKVVDHEEIDHEKVSLADYILYWLSQLSVAINCFSKENKHGEAGYGRVYKNMSLEITGALQLQLELKKRLHEPTKEEEEKQILNALRKPFP
ncbi:hypothetical protein Tco_0534413 [Tanacetum coccineum]